MPLAHLAPLLRPLATVDDDTFDELLMLSAGASAGKVSDLSRVSELVADGAAWPLHEALVALFLEAAREARTDELRTTLASVLPESRVSAIVDLAGQGQSAMRTALHACGVGFASLVDVHWERTAIAASADGARGGGESLYIVTLTTRGRDGALQTTPFTASIEELSALVATLKAAVKQVGSVCDGAS